jgi:hypothetical protein
LKSFGGSGGCTVLWMFIFILLFLQPNYPSNNFPDIFSGSF